MPNINNSATLADILARDAGIPDTVQLSQPAGSNSCGAYALAAGLGALMTWNHNIPIDYGVNAATILQTDTFRVAAGKIYHLTGILPEPGDDAPPPGGGYNSPAAMAQVAINFGRHVTICATAHAVHALGQLYPGEVAACLNVEGAVVSLNVAYAEPVPETDVQLICVFNGGGGLHFIARGSDGLYYDPADGVRNNDWGALGSADFTDNSGYQFAGLWLVLS